MKKRSNNPESEESKKETLEKQPVSPVVPGPHQSKLPLVLLLIFLLFLFGFGGFLLGKYLSVPQNIPAMPTLGSKPTVIPTTASDETANWKTYTNQDYGLEFKYPSNYTFNSLGPNTSQQQLNSGQQISGTVAPSYDTIEFKGADPQFELDIYHTGFDLNNLPFDGSCGSQFADKTLTEQILNKPFKHKLVVQQADNNTNIDLCFLNQKTNLITLKASTENKSNEIKNFLYQILSTFKFTSS